MFLVLRKDNATLQFAYQYAEGVKNYHAINDEPSWIPNISHFHEHRRDQSILNVILKCRYNQPDMQTYEHPCQWRKVRTYRLPEWDAETLTGVLRRTDEVFHWQERLFRNAAPEALANPNDVYWSSRP